MGPGDPVGIATWNYHEGTLADRIRRFAAMGFDAVSLSPGDASALCGGLTPDVEEEILSRGLAVTIHGAFTPGGNTTPDEVLLAEFQSYVGWHARTGLLYSVNYDAAGLCGADGEWEYDARTMRRVLRQMLSASNGSGVSVGVEDWPRTRDQLESVADLRAYPHFGILIDLGHLNLRVREGGPPGDDFPLKAARGYLDAVDLPINEVHVHNNDGVRDRHAPPTRGTADLAALAGILRRKGAHCVSTVEIVPAWCDLSEEQGVEAAREALDFWRTACAPAASGGPKVE